MNKKALLFIIALFIVVGVIFLTKKNSNQPVSDVKENKISMSTEESVEEPELPRKTDSIDNMDADEEEPELSDNANPGPSAETSEDEPELIKSYSLSEIAEHNSPNDCWFAVGGKVYDVTSFIASGKHPGGDAVLQGCGKDATELYETRPMGSGTPHSEKARESLENFYIGNLQ